MMVEIQKTLKLSLDDIKTMIEHKHNVEIKHISCSYRGIRCVLK